MAAGLGCERGETSSSQDSLVCNVSALHREIALRYASRETVRLFIGGNWVTYIIRKKEEDHGVPHCMDFHPRMGIKLSTYPS